MLTTITSLIVAANFTAYQTFGDRGITIPRAAGNQPRIEATTDRGLIVEMIVRCPQGSAIISYSKIERLFCDPQHKCSTDRAVVIKRTCG